MPSLDEQISQKLDEQLQTVKTELITFNSLQNITDKRDVIEKDLEELENKNKCNKGECMTFNCCSFSLI